jgi:hypothetical protein
MAQCQAGTGVRERGLAIQGALSHALLTMMDHLARGRKQILLSRLSLAIERPFTPWPSHIASPLGQWRA